MLSSKTFRHFLFFCLWLAGGVVFPIMLTAFSCAAAIPRFQADSPMDAEVEAAINRLLSCGEGMPLPVISELAPMLEYMMAADGASESQHPAEREEGEGIFWKARIDKPFNVTLRYFFNPNIASELLHPASVRQGHWLPGSDLPRLSKPLWERLRDITETPLVLRGEEYEEITPDDFSGSYYAYKQKDLTLFFQYKNIPMALRVSRQDTPSEKGMKGGFLGAYDDWNFIFTHDSGGTATGLGWLSTYMYSSVALSLYYSLDNRHTGYAVFKWLNAGWSGFNVVKRSHIISGANRNFVGMLEILRAKGGVSVEELEEITRDAGYYDRRTLLVLLASYSQALAQQSLADAVLKRNEFQEMLTGEGYAAKLNDNELRALFRINALKRKLGKAVLGG